MINRLVTGSFAMLVSAAVPATIVYENFSDLSAFQLNGASASLNPNGDDVLLLTDDLWQASSAFFADTISLSNQAAFSAAFQFQITDPQGIYDADGQGADGIAFVVQTESSTVGGLGGFLGYKGIDNSVAVEFDTWNNYHLDRNDGNHVAIDLNGDLNSIAQTSVAERMNNGEVWSAWVDYDGEVLEARLTQGEARPADPVVSAAVNLESILGTPDVYVGFTSGTGAAGNDHHILNFRFRSFYSPIAVITVPEPSTLLLFGLVGLGWVCGAVRRPRRC